MIKFESIIEFLKIFKDEEFCHNFLKNTLWGKNRERKACPACGSNKVHEYKDFKRNRCYDCKETFSIRKGTIFDDSKMPLQKWFVAIFLINSNKKGISSCAIAKQIKTTQKTAWFMLQRIREACKTEDFNNPFEGIIEIDEAYIGGSESNKHKHKKGQAIKTVVLGMVERNSKKVKSIKVESAKTYDLQPSIYSNVKEGSNIVTDSYSGYDCLDWNYKHETVKHCVGEYVKHSPRVAFKIHTNTIEGYWSIVKRGLNGIYHWASKKHIQRYLNEYSFRYNTRALEDCTRFNNFFANINSKITYKQLIA